MESKEIASGASEIIVSVVDMEFSIRVGGCMAAGIRRSEEDVQLAVAVKVAHFYSSAESCRALDDGAIFRTQSSRRVVPVNISTVGNSGVCVGNQ